MFLSKNKKKICIYPILCRAIDPDIKAIWSESLLVELFILVTPTIIQIDSEDSGQTAQLNGLIEVFTGSTHPQIPYIICLPDY